MEKGDKTEIEQVESINPQDIAFNYEIDEAKVSSCRRSRSLFPPAEPALSPASSQDRLDLDPLVVCLVLAILSR